MLKQYRWFVAAFWIHLLKSAASIWRIRPWIRRSAPRHWSWRRLDSPTLRSLNHLNLLGAIWWRRLKKTPLSPRRCPCLDKLGWTIRAHSRKQRRLVFGQACQQSLLRFPYHTLCWICFQAARRSSGAGNSGTGMQQLALPAPPATGPAFACGFDTNRPSASFAFATSSSAGFQRSQGRRSTSWFQSCGHWFQSCGHGRSSEGG